MTISSDEEEEGRNRKIASVNNNTPLINASHAFNENMDTILEKEPIITNTAIYSSYGDYLEKIEYDAASEGNVSLKKIYINKWTNKILADFTKW